MDWRGHDVKLICFRTRGKRLGPEGKREKPAYTHTEAD